MRIKSLMLGFGFAVLVPVAYSQTAHVEQVTAVQTNEAPVVQPLSDEEDVIKTYDEWVAFRQEVDAQIEKSLEEEDLEGLYAALHRYVRYTDWSKGSIRLRMRLQELQQLENLIKRNTARQSRVKKMRALAGMADQPSEFMSKVETDTADLEKRAAKARARYKQMLQDDIGVLIKEYEAGLPVARGGLESEVILKDIP